MKLTTNSMILWSTFCVCVSTALTLHRHRVTQFNPDNMTNEDVVEKIRDTSVILKRSSQRTGSGREAKHTSNTSHINQEILSLRLFKKSRIPVLKFLTRRNAQQSTYSGVRVTSSGAISETRNPSLSQHLRKVFKRTPEIDNFRDAYTVFYQLLLSFVELLPQRFKEGTPPALHNVNVLAEVMPLRDLDLITGDIDSIIKKFFVLQEATVTVLDNIRPFVLATYIEWLKRQAVILNWRMDIIGFTALSLRLQDNATDVTTMENFCQTYAGFFRELGEFVSLLCERYKSDVPDSLRNVTLISTILQLDDQDLEEARKVQIVEKYCIVEYVMTVVFNKAESYVAENHSEWFKERSKKLQWMMGTVTMSLATLGICDCSDEIQIVSSGIGSYNTGVRKGISYDFSNLTTAQMRIDVYLPESSSRITEEET